MDFKKLFRKDDKAVSPVIGVILMVAITVILAAAIGSSVFGQGTTKSAPQANFDIKAVNTSTGSSAWIKLEHLGGSEVHFENGGITKVSASLNGNSSVNITTSTSNLGTMGVGDVKVLELKGTDGQLGTGAYPQSGDTVNIKIIDVQTNQLICDKDVRF